MNLGNPINNRNFGQNQNNPRGEVQEYLSNKQLNKNNQYNFQGEVPEYLSNKQMNKFQIIYLINN